MAKKQVTVNEEMIRGIMAGDIPNYGKDISVDDVITTDESDGNECEADNPGPVTVEKSTGKPKKRKDVTDSYRKEFLSGGNVLQRQQAYIGIDNYRLIQKFLSVVAPKISMSKFIDNVLTAHFEQYKEEIDGLYYAVLLVFNLTWLIANFISGRKNKKVSPNNNIDNDMKKEQLEQKESPIEYSPIDSMTFEEVYEKISEQTKADYIEKFLICHPASNRIQVYANRSDIEWIKRILPVIAPKATVSGFISNIIADHLQKYEKEIMEMYNENTSKFLDYGN